MNSSQLNQLENMFQSLKNKFESFKKMKNSKQFKELTENTQQIQQELQKIQSNKKMIFESNIILDKENQNKKSYFNGIGFQESLVKKSKSFIKEKLR